MGTLLYFFAPIFLTPSPSLLPPIAMQVGEAGEAAEEAADQAAPEEAPVEEAPAEEAPVEEAPVAEAPSAQETAHAAPQDDEALEAQLRQREEIRTVHRAFGIATWISLAVNIVVGGMTFYDEYGSPDFTQNPCAQAHPILSQDFCINGLQVPMLVTGVTATALYFTTFTLSFLMPDPLGVAEAPGWAGDRLQIHKALRWAHLGAMIATLAFGFVSGLFHRDCVPGDIAGCQSTYETQQALAAVHLGLGITTFGLLSAAAAVILF